jgi:hypothetical protein
MGAGDSTEFLVKDASGECSAECRVIGIGRSY